MNRLQEVFVLSSRLQTSQSRRLVHLATVQYSPNYPPRYGLLSLPLLPPSWPKYTHILLSLLTCLSHLEGLSLIPQADRFIASGIPNTQEGPAANTGLELLMAGAHLTG